MMSVMHLGIYQVAILKQGHICVFDLLFEGHSSLDVTTLMKDPAKIFNNLSWHIPVCYLKSRSYL